MVFLRSITMKQKVDNKVCLMLAHTPTHTHPHTPTHTHPHTLTHTFTYSYNHRIHSSELGDKVVKKISEM